MSETDYETELKTLQKVLAILSDVAPAARNRIMRAISAFVPGANSEDESPVRNDESGGRRSPKVLKFSEDRSPTSKEFMMTKRPQTDVERVACLGYYLTHYRDTDEFK